MLKILFLLVVPLSLFAECAFKTVVMGCSGGPDSGNLSGYLIAPIDSMTYYAFDAGTTLDGIADAVTKQSFPDLRLKKGPPFEVAIEILQKHVQGYCISHAHLDHVAGLVLSSVVDTPKPIYAIPSTVEFIKKDLFNNDIWPNMASTGQEPCVGKYTYHNLTTEEWIQLPGIDMTIEPFYLSHPDGYQSTAFLIESQGEYLLYFGDTAPDALEKVKHIKTIWEQVAPLVKKKKLHGIFLECSFTNKTPDHLLYGHLKPKYVLEELNKLAEMVSPTDPEHALEGLNMIVTHIKHLYVDGKPQEEIIRNELAVLNNLHVKFIFAKQGNRIEL